MLTWITTVSYSDIARDFSANVSHRRQLFQNLLRHHHSIQRPRQSRPRSPKSAKPRTRPVPRLNRQLQMDHLVNYLPGGHFPSRQPGYFESPIRR